MEKVTSVDRNTREVVQVLLLFSEIIALQRKALQIYHHMDIR